MKHSVGVHGIVHTLSRRIELRIFGGLSRVFNCDADNKAECAAIETIANHGHCEMDHQCDRIL